MASRPPVSLSPEPRPLSSQQLMTLGMFVFGMETAAYQSLTRSREWRWATSERHGDRPAAQYSGTGAETVSLSGLIVPELGGDYGALETLAEMAEAGEHYPLMDGTGRIFGHFRITALDEDHLSVMAGGLPRHKGFTVELERGDDAEADE